MRLLKKISSFSSLNATQFLVVLNDSIFRLVVAYSLIDLLGEGESNRILSISAALFVTPFLLFSMPAGQLADKFSKKIVIMWTLWAELIFMVLAIFAIIIKDEFTLYFALFLIALQSAIFSPSKYSILPEIESEDRLSRVNGIMTLTSYLSIILGTFLASFISDITNRNYAFVVLLCIIFSIIAILTGLGIEKTPVQNREKKVNPWFIIDIFKTLKIASKYPHLLLTLFAVSYFLFTAGFTQLNLIPFGLQSLGITEVQTGYVYLAAALGIGAGSITVGLISEKTIELGLSIWGAFGTAASYILLYFFQYHLVISCFIFFSLGFHGGLFVVPMDAYMQYASPKKERGSVVAAATFLSFFGVLLSAGALALFGEVLLLKAATGFLIIGVVTLLFAFSILFLLPNYSTRLIAILVARLFYTISTAKLPQRGILLCDRKTIKNLFSLISCFQKIRVLKWSKKSPSQIRINFNKIFNTLPFNLNSLSLIQKTLDRGYILCLFGDKSLDVLKSEIEAPFYRVSVVTKNNESSNSSFLSLLQQKIDIHFEQIN